MNKTPLVILAAFLPAAAWAASTSVPSSPANSEPTWLPQGPCGMSQKAVQDLLAHGRIDQGNSDGETALHCAAVSGDADLAKTLLEHGANADARNNQGQAPLEVAAGLERKYAQAQAKVMTVLLDHHADVDAEDSRNETALQVACMRVNPVLVKLLLDRGANVEIADVDGMTPLLWASSPDESAPIIEMLLDHHASLAAVRVNGMTALHFAAANGAPKSAEILLAHEAFVDPVDKKGETPLAMSCGKAVARVLLAHGADKARLSAAQRKELAKTGEVSACPVFGAPERKPATRGS